jgi:hypothetical protein
MAFGKRRFAGAGRADEDDQAWILDDDDGHGAMMPQIRGGACPALAPCEAVRRTS